MFTRKLMFADQTMPFIVQPEAAQGNVTVNNLLSYYKANFDYLEMKILEHGALLFRDFGIKTPASFARCVKSLNSNLLDYIDGNSPRTKLTSGVYTSTEYPSEYYISMHNELSYSQKWPRRLFFGCIVAPQEKGETPIADSRAILKALDADVVEEFTRKGVKYIRNLQGGNGVGPSWQETFETTDKAAVEQYAAACGAEVEWRADGSVKLTQIRPAVAEHPQTKQHVWFNQADQFHPSTHPRAIYDNMMSVYAGKEDALPQNALFGDDTPIDVAMLEHIRETTRKNSVVFPWQEGDLLIIDNMLTCHGRMPYAGPRKILVSMS
ncbi:MAG TPA: TauD/TfdA family dioxygenase [Pyrinomonadaceae bacterium]|nr:TauD/TfdA family dioxygenase [Pyrinomonadaceae bacterium]